MGVSLNTLEKVEISIFDKRLPLSSQNVTLYSTILESTRGDASCEGDAKYPGAGGLRSDSVRAR